MAVKVEARKAIEQDLRRALERDELFLARNMHQGWRV